MPKKHSFMICTVYCVLVVALSVLIFVPKSDFSPRENRILATMPRLTADSLANGEFTRRFSNYCTDRFPFRDSLLSLDSSFELALGRLEAKGVMAGQDHNLIKRLEYTDLSTLDKNLEGIENIRLTAENEGINTVFFCAPRAVDVLCDFCPPLFDTVHSGQVWKHIKTAETATQALRELAAEGKYVFYRTDHHWTSLGAYCTYRRLGASLGYFPIELANFSPQEVCTDFFGTTYSAALLPLVSPDTITLLRYDGDTELKVTDVMTERELTLYDFSALEGSSKYDVFLGGNRAILRIESQNRPELVIIKDSFANSLIPLLAAHYNITAVDPRYLRAPLDETLASLYAAHRPDHILILFGIDTLTEEIGVGESYK